MRLAEITPRTPPYMVYLSANDRPERDDKWADNFHGWSNVQLAHRQALYEAMGNATPSPVDKAGKGILVCGGGRYLCSAYVTLRAYRHVGCTLPAVVAHIGKGELDDFHRGLFSELGVEFLDLEEHEEWNSLRLTQTKEAGWLSKAWALRLCKFRTVIASDADSYPVKDPTFLLGHDAFVKTGAVFWPDVASHDIPDWKWEILGLDPQNCWCLESGQMVVDTKDCWRELAVACWMNDHHDYYYRLFWGDKETFAIAWRLFDRPYAMPQRRFCKINEQVLVQYDLENPPAPLWVHRCRCKYVPVVTNQRYELFWNTRQDGRAQALPFHAELPLETETRVFYRQYMEKFRCR